MVADSPGLMDASQLSLQSNGECRSFLVGVDGDDGDGPPWQ